MLIGEQPGDQEDRAGHPFVGPAGKILDEALFASGIPRDQVYVTNAVKHFKWKLSGKRRLHSKPAASEVRACFDWLEKEIQIVNPEIIVCMGATATFSIFDRNLPIHANRHQWMESAWCKRTTITVHPSSILRNPDSEGRAKAMQELIDDFRFVRKGLKP